ncbi:MAG TPA: DUF309 domain-containing protein [Dehalococcoidia bacterium]|nr:DUF309 domain-containing protein [Dehalococcoidia bacterium]
MSDTTLRNAALLTPEQLRSRLDEFYQAVQEFNDGYYFESHETLEDLWMVTPEPERQLFQAIIQLAAAFVHLSRGELPGTIKLLDAACDKLSDFTPEALGLDVAALRSAAGLARSELAGLGPEQFLRWDLAHIPVMTAERSTAV